MKNLSVAFVLMAGLVSGCGRVASPLSVYQVEPLVKVLPCDSVFVDSPDTMHVAKGESASFQFVITTSQNVSGLQADVCPDKLGEVKTGWVHDVHNENPTHGADDMIVTPDNNYPDPIIDDEQEDLSAGKKKTLWVDVAIPRDAKDGVHKCKLAIKGETAQGKTVVKKNFFVKVYPVTLPEEQKLNVVNWYTPSTLKFLNNGDPVEKYSDRYFELLQLIAEKGAAYGQNCWLIQEKPVLVMNADSTDFTLDFTYFDKAVQMFIEHGNLKSFHNSHLGSRFPGAKWSEGHCFTVNYVEDKQIKQDIVGYQDPRLKDYIQKYYSQLQEHLREKGWLNMCCQHIADEPDNPGTESQKSWTAVAGMVKQAAPELKTIDASFEIIENQDVSVIILGNNIATLPPVPEGSQMWMYTCTGPQGNFANRFIQLPLIKTRILHWINFKYNEEGYLHWGFNYWGHSRSPLVDVTPETAWPGGDCFIIYPGYNKVYPSIRLCAMRDGIRDYDLLKMLEEVDARKAKEICDRIILGPDSYNLDIKHFYDTRKEILEILSRSVKK